MYEVIIFESETDEKSSIKFMRISFHSYIVDLARTIIRGLGENVLTALTVFRINSPFNFSVT